MAFCNSGVIPPVLQQICQLCHFLQESAILGGWAPSGQLDGPYPISWPHTFSSQIWQTQETNRDEENVVIMKEQQIMSHVILYSRVTVTVGWVCIEPKTLYSSGTRKPFLSDSRPNLGVQLISSCTKLMDSTELTWDRIVTQIGRALAMPTGATWVESANNDLKFGHQLHRDGFSVISSDGNWWCWSFFWLQFLRHKMIEIPDVGP